MTGYDSKRQMAAKKLWDRPSVAFAEWWNNDHDESTNPFRPDSDAYWAWAAWKAALAQPALPVQPAQEQNTITFSTSADWVMRITADRRIEINEGVDVTDAAKKVLEAMQWMLKPAQECEALKLALDALEELLEQTETPPDKNCSCHIAPPCPDCVDYSGVRYAIEQTNKAITSIKAALAQPAQEPVECLDCGSHNVGLPANYDSLVDSVKTQPVQEPVALVIDGFLVKSELPEQYTGHLYTTPPKREWVGLTEEEIHNLDPASDSMLDQQRIDFARATEAKLKKKNT